MSRALADVIAYAWPDFVPERPERRPWQRSHPRFELAHTGNVVTVPLRIADRVTLHGLDRPSFEQDEFFEDWTREGWTPAA